MPDPQVPANIAAQSSQATPPGAGPAATPDHSLAHGRTGEVVRIDGYSVFVDTGTYSPALVRALMGGAYEARERRVINAMLRPGDRVLGAGTAMGVVAMTIAGIVGAENLVTYDANPAIMADARRNFAANGLSAIASHAGVLRNRSRWQAGEPSVEFFIAQDFWSSRLDATRQSPGITGSVTVPVVCLEDVIAKHGISVLVCDIEGGEVDLFNGADLRGIRLIVMETHYGITGRKAADTMLRNLLAAGFDLHLGQSGAHVVVLDPGVTTARRGRPAIARHATPAVAALAAHR